MSNPKIYKHFDFEVSFPGATPIAIHAYDYDDLFGDELIGTTYIDLDDRFFSPEWRSLRVKPIEYRQIYVPSSTVAQGVIKLWVELHETNKAGISEAYKVAPRPEKEYQMRLVVWDTVDVVNMDIEGTSDVYGRAFFDTKEAKETDTHYRCMNGKASFNYRLLFDIKCPRDFYLFTIQLWDRDLFCSNDMIGEAQLELKALFEDVLESGKQMNLNKKYYDSYLKDHIGETKIKFEDEDSFWIPCKGFDKDGKHVEQGKVRVSLTILPKEEAEKQKVGDARSEPNHSPFCPPPKGRISFTLNPFKMLAQLVGPGVLRKIYCLICCAIYCSLFIMMAPMLLSTLIGLAISASFDAAAGK